MSKLKSRAFDEFDILNYKLETLEKRLDNLEALIHKQHGNSTNADILHLLLDMIKQQTLQPQQAQQQSVPVATAVAEAIASKAQQTPSTLESSFDSLTCMGRRRTLT